MVIKAFSLTASRQAPVTVELPTDFTIVHAEWVQEGATIVYGPSSAVTTVERTFYLSTVDEEVPNATYVATLKDNSDYVWHILEITS